MTKYPARGSAEAKLKNAVKSLQKIQSRPDKMVWGEDYEVTEAMRDMEKLAYDTLASIGDKTDD
jgi:uncharacterized protein with WD repeat